MKLVQTILAMALTCAPLAAIDLNSFDMREYFAGKAEPIEIPGGDGLSLKTELKVLIDRPYFVKCTGEDFLFSFDQVTWHPFMEFFQGNIHISPYTQHDQLHLNVNIDLTERLK